MKKLNIVCGVLVSALLFGCNKGNNELCLNESFNLMQNVVAISEALETYSIDVTTVENSVTTHEKKQLSKDSNGAFVGYYEINSVGSYWLNGFEYSIVENQKIKTAKSLSSFLNTSDMSYSYTFDDVKDSFKVDGYKFDFDLSLSQNEDVHLTIKSTKYFVTSIRATFSNNGTEYKTKNYKYNNPGTNPLIVLPNDLNEYTY